MKKLLLVLLSISLLTACGDNRADRERAMDRARAAYLCKEHSGWLNASSTFLDIAILCKDGKRIQMTTPEFQNVTDASIPGYLEEEFKQLEAEEKKK